MSKLIPVQTNGHDHIDSNLLAAFAEGTLDQRERTTLFAHMAECERCREELRIHTHFIGFAQPEASNNRYDSGRFTNLPFPTVAGIACAALCVVLILFYQQEQQKDSHVVLNADQRLSRSDLQELHSPVTLWKTVHFRCSQFVFSHRSTSDFSPLPGPFISARLDLQTNFQTALWTSSKQKEANSNGSPKEIAVKTALGERRIYIDLSNTESTFSQ